MPAKKLKAVALTPTQRRMQKAVESLTRYMVTYSDQMGYLDYSDKIFIDDVLYGLGRALDEGKYGFGDGFDRFKAVLREHLGARPTGDQHGG